MSFSGKRPSLDKDNTQMMIDAGQKEFGVWQCPSCGLMLEVGNASDDASHTEYHDHLFAALKHNVSLLIEEKSRKSNFLFAFDNNHPFCTE